MLQPGLQNADCRSRQSHAGAVIVGVAAHITAAASGGPRFDPSLTPEERRGQSNGIWLCQIHGKQVDLDSGHFAVEMLRSWKQTAEQESFEAITARNAAGDRRTALNMPDTAMIARLSKDWDYLQATIFNQSPQICSMQPRPTWSHSSECRDGLNMPLRSTSKWWIATTHMHSMFRVSPR